MAGGSGGHAFVFKNGVLNPIFDNEDGVANNNIIALGLSGQWAAIGGFSASGFRLVLVNVLTREHRILATTGDALPGGFNFRTMSMSSGTVTPDGVVYFVSFSSDGKTSKVYRATVMGVPSIIEFVASPMNVTA
jgi:hypothetical protein